MKLNRLEAVNDNDSAPPLYWNARYAVDCIKERLDQVVEAMGNATCPNSATNAVVLTRLMDFDDQLTPLLRALGHREPWEQSR